MTKKKTSNPSSSEWHKAAGRKAILVWLEPESHELIRKAAEKLAVPMTTFVIDAAMQRTDRMNLS